MRRIVFIAAALLLVALLIALPAVGSNGSGGSYEVRGIFDNGSFVVNGEQVRVAGANVGTVKSVDVTGNDEIARHPRSYDTNQVIEQEAGLDQPIRIGHGQVTTRPSLVARMVEALRPDGSDRALEIGTGHGYQTAILAELTAS